MKSTPDGNEFATRARTKRDKSNLSKMVNTALLTYIGPYCVPPADADTESMATDRPQVWIWGPVHNLTKPGKYLNQFGEVWLGWRSRADGEARSNLQQMWSHVPIPIRTAKAQSP